MPLLQFETVLPFTQQQVWDFHQGKGVVEKLTPPGLKLEVLSKDNELRNGAIHKIRIRKFGIPFVWEVQISDVIPPMRFRDRAIRSPFKTWVHTHEMLPHSDGTLLKDSLEIEMPFGTFGRIAFALFVKRDLEKMFDYRHAQTRNALEAEHSFAEQAIVWH